MKPSKEFINRLMMTLLFMAMFFIPRIQNLDAFMATDEGAWTYRAGNFYYALGQREFSKTYINPYPGIVTSWIGTSALLLDFPEYRALNQGYFADYDSYEEFLVEQGISPFDLIVTGRKVMVLFLTLLFGCSFLVSLEVFGMGLSVPAFFLIGFDSLFLAISRTYHLDAPMAGLIFLSALLLLWYYKRERKSVLLLLLSGAVAGAAVLAKLPSAVYAVSVVVFIVSAPFIFDEGQGGRFWEKMKQIASSIFLWGAASFLSFSLFWPAMWVKPINTFSNLVTYALGASEGSLQTASNFVEPTTFFFYNPLYKSWMNYPASFMWRTTPIILFGLLVAIGCFLSKIKPWNQRRFKQAIFFLLTFIAIYTFVLSISAKQSQKYFLPAILVINLIAGFGLASLPDLMRKVWPDKRVIWHKVGLGMVAVILIGQIALILPTHPYYFTYYNPLLGGAEKAAETIFVGTGEGLNLAGDYLNQKPNSADINVLAWYGKGCLSYFFDGNVEIINLDNNWSEDEQAALKWADYLVTYSNQWFRDRPEELLDLLEDVEPEHTIWIDGIEYARIYQTDQLPAELYGE